MYPENVAMPDNYHIIIINPRHTCAARVICFVCVSVCYHLFSQHGRFSPNKAYQKIQRDAGTI